MTAIADQFHDLRILKLAGIVWEPTNFVRLFELFASSRLRDFSVVSGEIMFTAKMFSKMHAFVEQLHVTVRRNEVLPAPVLIVILILSCTIPVTLLCTWAL